jgi:hypothetical protein
MSKLVAWENRIRAVDNAQNPTSRLGSHSLTPYVGPFCQQFSPGPRRDGWPCETIGPKPFARPSSLLVYPGDIYPPQRPCSRPRRRPPRPPRGPCPWPRRCSPRPRVAPARGPDGALTGRPRQRPSPDRPRRPPRGPDGAPPLLGRAPPRAPCSAPSLAAPALARRGCAPLAWLAWPPARSAQPHASPARPRAPPARATCSHAHSPTRVGIVLLVLINFKLCLINMLCRVLHRVAN